MFAPRLVLAAAALVASPSALARVLKPVEVTASSSLADTEGVSYAVKNVIDAKQSTVWVEGEDGSGLGSWVEVNLGGEQDVTELRLWNGNWYTWDFWNRHNRVKDLDVEFSDGSKESFVLKDEMTPETIRFAKAHRTTTVKLRVKGIHRGSTFNDTCLSEVQVMDDAAPDFASVAKYSASSTYPADGDGNYELVNLADALLDSMWCEGNKTGDGTGEWVEFDFGRSQRVSRLRVRNGNAYSVAFNLKANRAKSAQLTFSDGSSETVTLRPTPLEQVVEFAPRTTRSVRVEFVEVVKGTEFNDLCLSEAQFLE